MGRAPSIHAPAGRLAICNNETLAEDATPAERRQRFEEKWALGGINLLIDSYVGAVVDPELNAEISAFVRERFKTR